MNPSIELAIVLTALAIFALGMGSATYVFSKAMLLVVQTMAFAYAASAKARSAEEFERAVAEQALRVGTRPERPEVHSDDELIAAARAGRATTGDSFIPGYDTPPPTEGESFSGAHNDGEAPGADQFAPAGGQYRDGRSEA